MLPHDAVGQTRWVTCSHAWYVLQSPATLQHTAGIAMRTTDQLMTQARHSSAAGLVPRQRLLYLLRVV